MSRSSVAALTVALVASLFGAATPVLAVQPDAVNDSVVVQRNAAATTLTVLANDTVDPTSVISATTTPANGAVTIASDGLSVIYTPTTGYSGADTFAYTVTDTAGLADTATVTVKVNAPPSVVDDPPAPSCISSGFGGAFPIAEDAAEFPFAGQCSAIANDADGDGTIVSWQIDTLPAHGALDWLPGQPGVFGYTPDPDYSTIAGDQPGGQWVSDSLTYRLVDDNGGLSAPATYRFWIAPVNDAPFFLTGPPDVTVAEDSGPYDESWAPWFAAGPPNESDQNVTFVITSGEFHGVVDLFTNRPTFTADGRLTFTTGPNEHGWARITGYLKDDGGLGSFPGAGSPPDDTGDTVTFDIFVTSVAEAPIAADDTLTVAEDGPATDAGVLANDSDPDGDSFTVTATTDGTKGTVAIGGGGAGLTYDPAPDATGTDSFTYTITDSTGATDTATVTVTISPVNDAPVAGVDAVTVSEDQAGPTDVTVLANDSDVDGDALLVTAKTNGAKGVVTITGGGTGVAYKPNANAYGADSFTYTVSDGNGGSTTATVAVTISPVNDNPNAVNDGVPTPYKVYLKAGPTAIPVLANDTSVPDATETLTIIAVTQGAHGTVAISGGGTGLTYAAVGTTTGVDVFTYTVSDGSGGTDTASVQVTVAADTTRPVATAPVITTSHRGRTTIRLSLTWTLSDGGSGIASQLLQRRMDGGSWITVALASSSVRTATFTVTRGHAYTYRIRATDRSGNIGAFATSQLVQT